MMLACGFTKPIATLGHRDVPSLIECVTLHTTIFQIKAELDQFMEGLKSACVLDMLQAYPHLCQPFFVYSSQALTAGLKEMYAHVMSGIMSVLFICRWTTRSVCGEGVFSTR